MTLVSVALFRFVELPSFSWSLNRVLGSPLGFTIGGNWILTALLMGLVAAGTLSLMQTHPHRDAPERPLSISLIAPTLGALLASLLLSRTSTWPVWLLLLGVTGLTIGILEHLSYRAFSARDSGYATARTVLNIIDYLLGFALFGLILSEQGRTLITGPAVLLLTTLLALDLLSASGAPIRKVLLFGVICGLLGGQFTWLLSYWPISFWMSATLLSLNLYLWSGLSYQYLLQRLTRRVLVEFALLTLLVFVLLLWLRP